jgi:hypothetical protein
MPSQKKFLNNKKGSILLFVVMFGLLAMGVIITGVAGYAVFEHRASTRLYERDEAFQIAEAGIDYYRWHLAHTPNDYQDGTNHSGPYVHAYTDKDGNVIGYYSLAITAPITGSTITTIVSTGWTVAEPNARRVIRVRLGFPALTNNTFLTNADMSFSRTTVVNGIVQSNGGIRFDGTTNSWVRSARSTYTYSGATHNGVWGIGGPQSFWEFPVPAVDFNSVTADLAAVQTSADNGGIHLYSSGRNGWRLVFLTNGTFNLYRVTSRCYNGYCYDIQTSTLVSNNAIPANGAIFVEDNVWVEGVVHGRVTIGAGRFPVLPATYRDIIISNNLTYQSQASTDVIGLIAQRDIVVPHNVPTDMTINAAALAQFGSIYTPPYTQTRNSLTFSGSQISFGSGGWKYVNAGGTVVSGFINTNHIYDGNLRYYPPPGFPVGNVYDLVSWEELQ